MSMKKIKRAVVKTGEYEQNGQTKGRYHTVGAMFKRDDGSVTVSLDSIPLGVTGSLWINFYDLDEQKQEPQQSAPQEPADEIPF